jgi:hypothetical protein
MNDEPLPIRSLSFAIPKSRQEDCGTCRWSHAPKGGHLECHLNPPHVQVVFVPSMLRPGTAEERTICPWPLVRPGVDFCSRWQSRATKNDAA